MGFTMYLLKILQLCIYDFTKLRNFEIQNLSQMFDIVTDTPLCNDFL